MRFASKKDELLKKLFRLIKKLAKQQIGKDIKIDEFSV